MNSADPGNEILNSWKEVAQYLGRGVRTVQRWERELGLPVRRPRGKSRSPIMALREELDSWLNNSPQATNYHANGNEAGSPPPEGEFAALSNVSDMILKSRDLRSESRALRAEMCEALNALVANLTLIRGTCRNRVRGAPPDLHRA